MRMNVGMYATSSIKTLTAKPARGSLIVLKLRKRVNESEKTGRNAAGADEDIFASLSEQILELILFVMQ